MGDDTDGMFRLNISMYGVIIHFKINGGYSELYVSTSWQRALTRPDVILGLTTRHTFAMLFPACSFEVSVELLWYHSVGYIVVPPILVH